MNRIAVDTPWATTSAHAHTPLLARKIVPLWFAALLPLVFGLLGYILRVPEGAPNMDATYADARVTCPLGVDAINRASAARQPAEGSALAAMCRSYYDGQLDLLHGAGYGR